MSVVKSFSVGNGDMFYIGHNSGSFTIIDCCLVADDAEDILNEVAERAAASSVVRFISTHPDEDHLRGLTLLDERVGIRNFYCVENATTKPDESEDFVRYRQLHDSRKAFFLSKGCRRRWLNEEDTVRGASGLHIHWPDTSHEEFEWALQDASDGQSPNNLSPVIEYRAQCARFMWMGDLETDFLDAVADDLEVQSVTILFAPHHGRESGRVPERLLRVLNPQIVIIGEAPSEHLNYYRGYSTITQNSADDIVFDCSEDAVDIYIGSSTYGVDFLHNLRLPYKFGYYIGSLVR